MHTQVYMILVQEMSHQELLNEFGQLHCYCPESEISDEVLSEMIEICEQELMCRLSQ